MARTPSIMVPLREPAPDFVLPEPLTGAKRSLRELRGDRATVVMFICNHCPYVKHVNPELVRLARTYEPEGVSFIAISSNDVQSHPEDGPQEMKKTALELDYPFPYLYDETQEIATAYKAACTPDFFIYDATLSLVYRGQLDDSRPNSGVPLTGKDVRSALDALLEGNPVDEDQKPSIGCNIKWKVGA